MYETIIGFILKIIITIWKQGLDGKNGEKSADFLKRFLRARQKKKYFFRPPSLPRFILLS
jgi:hypothetical protein